MYSVHCTVALGYRYSCNNNNGFLVTVDCTHTPLRLRVEEQRESERAMEKVVRGGRGVENERGE